MRRRSSEDGPSIHQTYTHHYFRHHHNHHISSPSISTQTLSTSSTLLTPMTRWFLKGGKCIPLNGVSIYMFLLFEFIWPCSKININDWSDHLLTNIQINISLYKQTLEGLGAPTCVNTHIVYSYTCVHCIFYTYIYVHPRELSLNLT